MIQRSDLTLLVLIAIGSSNLCGQSTQGVIMGRVFDKRSGSSLAGAVVRYSNLENGATDVVRSNDLGIYALPSLSPGTYKLRAAFFAYQPQEVYQMVLAVAARLEFDFELRPMSDVWETGFYRMLTLPNEQVALPFFGPDLQSGRASVLTSIQPKTGTLQATLSYVIDERQLDKLPLAGRDAYSLIVTLPGVTVDSSSGRGLGLSVAGQRASSSNFLVDGIEHNDYLTTGSFSPITPEMVQEYRISTNNYSAEFGRTSGFLSNAVTISGTNSYHGLAYGYVHNEALDANSFRFNSLRLARRPQKELQIGYSGSGPILKDRLFFSSTFEQFRSRSRSDPEDLAIPVPEAIRGCLGEAVSPIALGLLERFRPTGIPPLGRPTGNPCRDAVNSFTLAAPVSIDRSLGLERADYQWGANRLMGRLLFSRQSQPDFICSVYPGFNSRLVINTTGFAVNYTRNLKPGWINELLATRRTGDLHWDRPHPEIPTLVTDIVALPGSEALYDFANRDGNWELRDSVVLSRNRHVLTVGGGLLTRRIESLLSFGRDGRYVFDDLGEFARARPLFVQASVGRNSSLQRVQPPYGRQYSNNQFFGFLQENWKASPRVAINLGVRYESFGTLKNTGVRDAYVQLARGQSIQERLGGAKLVFNDQSHDAAYRPDRNNWAGRFGTAYDLFGKGKTVLRAAYGIFYDRPFDNLTENARNNNLDFPVFSSGGLFDGFLFDFLQPIGEAIPKFTNVRQTNFVPVLWVDENLRSPYIQSWFSGMQQQITPSLLLEVNYVGNIGRKLITTDIVNRLFSLLNPNLPRNISYRSNQGSSRYQAMTMLGRYRARRGQFQLAYTYGHSVDNQSDAIKGDFFDLKFARSLTLDRTTSSLTSSSATFTRQFDSAADRGNSDYDQRHNLFFLSIWELPAVSRQGLTGKIAGGWQVSQMAGFRSGFPYSVLAGARPSDISVGNISDLYTIPFGFDGVFLLNNRADLLPGRKPELSPRIATAGGALLVDTTAFHNPVFGLLGNSGRNSLYGPGFWNVDLSVGRSFPLPWLGEARRMQFRADFFNLFNHANLDRPDGALYSSSFGIATFGRKGTAPGFPAIAPLNESPRRIQLQLKLYF